MKIAHNLLILYSIFVNCDLKIIIEESIANINAFIWVKGAIKLGKYYFDSAISQR
jgi:hypothetical protein